MSTPAADEPAATVVGGGPAGLIAAETLRAAGLKVTVFDHKRAVGRKFVLAGRGGLNITKAEPFDQFMANYTSAAPWIEPALRQFGPEELRAWCAELGEPTFVGSSGRVFPESFRAVPLLRAWQRRLVDQGVTFAGQHRFVDYASVEGASSARTETRFSTPSGSHSEFSDVVVLALGGASWPRVGSDGTWTEALTRAGVAVAELRAANCGVVTQWSPHFIGRFAGEPLKNVAVGLDGHWVRGEPVVTRRGLEGGPIYAHSQAIRDALDRDGEATLDINLQPDLDSTAMAQRLGSRRSKDSLSKWFRRAGLPPIALGLVREVTGNNVPADPSDLAALLGAVPVRVGAVMPIERAISSAGGVKFEAVDARFMLRSSPGVFVAGEMLDWEAPTGGYLLQACFSTGVAAARGAIDWLNRSDS